MIPGLCKCLSHEHHRKTTDGDLRKIQSRKIFHFLGLEWEFDLFLLPEPSTSVLPLCSFICSVGETVCFCIFVIVTTAMLFTLHTHLFTCVPHNLVRSMRLRPTTFSSGLHVFQNNFLSCFGLFGFFLSLPFSPLHLILAKFSY